MELQLDKLKQKGAIKRAMFLHSSLSSHEKKMKVENNRRKVCEELEAYLRVCRFGIFPLEIIIFDHFQRKSQSCIPVPSRYMPSLAKMVGKLPSPSYYSCAVLM